MSNQPNIFGDSSAVLHVNQSVHATDIHVEDKDLVLGKNQTTTAGIDGAGILCGASGANQRGLTWHNSSSSFTMNSGFRPQGSVISSGDALYDLGSAEAQFKTIYGRDVETDNIQSSGASIALKCMVLPSVDNTYIRRGKRGEAGP